MNELIEQWFKKPVTEKARATTEEHPETEYCMVCGEYHKGKTGSCRHCGARDFIVENY